MELDVTHMMEEFDLHSRHSGAQMIDRIIILLICFFMGVPLAIASRLIF